MWVMLARTFRGDAGIAVVGVRYGVMVLFFDGDWVMMLPPYVYLYN